MRPVARTPSQAVTLYNRAIRAGDYPAACRLLTARGRTSAVHDGRQAVGPGKRKPSTCAASLRLLAPPTPENRKLRGARVVRVRPEPDGGAGFVVTQRFADGIELDVIVKRRGRNWLVVVSPYTAYA